MNHQLRRVDLALPGELVETAGMGMLSVERIGYYGLAQRGPSKGYCWKKCKTSAWCLAASDEDYVNCYTCPTAVQCSPIFTHGRQGGNIPCGCGASGCSSWTQKLGSKIRPGGNVW